MVLPGDAIQVEGLRTGPVFGHVVWVTAAVKGRILRCRDRPNDPRLYWLDTIEKRVSTGKCSHYKISVLFNIKCSF